MADGKKDIQPPVADGVNWDSANPSQSLDNLRTFVEAEAQKAANWYWREKNGKKTPSQAIQFLAMALTAAAGLVPVAIQILKNWKKVSDSFDSGPVASLLVGLAAGLIGLDRAFGYSSGWTRYVLTATSMTKLLQEFRVDWIATSAASASLPPIDQQVKLIQLAKSFVSAVQGMLLQETKDWATEFQGNMNQMEKDVKTQLDVLKAQIDKLAKEREEANRPGAIELTIPNADQTDGFRFDVALEGKSPYAGSVLNSKVWTNINTSPGQYRITIDAKAKGAPVSTSTVFEVKSGETAKPSVSLPIP